MKTTILIGLLFLAAGGTDKRENISDVETYIDPLTKYEIRDNRNEIDKSGQLVKLTESTVQFQRAVEKYEKKD